MSQITVLGFSPSRPDEQGFNAIHWAILLTPATEAQQQQQGYGAQQPSTKRPKTKSFFSTPRLLSKTSSNATPPLETVLYDMHNHQLRQQVYPVPVKAKSDSTEQSNSSSAEAETAAENLQTTATTTDISSDIRNQPFRLCLRILLSSHNLPVTKLASKVSNLLYRTPTYGPEEDWLLAALHMLVGAGILEPSQNFDPEAILAFAGEAVKENLSQIGHRYERQQEEVLELDYASHVRSIEQVKAMFEHHHQQQATPPYTPSPTPSPTSSSPVIRGAVVSPAIGNVERRGSSATSHFHHDHSCKPKTHKFLGLRISPSPSSYAPRHRWASGEGMKRAYYERQDDPYGGLM
ncbi:hypothetical protein Z517_02097 [Fonsecaea pedrosoi CBS 271.37]|uniref:Uncharacterized protein n=1 Tax=Fonsecaea pedrosoi CBS 271.37 TaxID=1442368 RepID=A0A0D2HEF1_9EURO|nr:uncharacterized protein Z517_02097 [Fonsecaea pedrosoi CBS 271.37]KIW82854.1 hypothetical protein Z517_02097 [Fonsecaea pedrosoi CBS 271.37]